MNKEKKRKIYLSLPISGYDLDERRKTAQKAEDMLSADWEVVNPLKNGLSPEAGTHAHMRRDIELLLGCDAIYLMKRFTHSAGCMTEFHVATAIGLRVCFEEYCGVEDIKFE